MPPACPGDQGVRAARRATALVADLTWPGSVLGPESLGGRVQIAVLNAAAPRADRDGRRHW